MMKKNLMIAAAAASLVGLASAASAADLDRQFVPTQAPQIQSPITPAAKIRAYDWSGMYLGGHVGYGWGDHRFENSLYDQGVVQPNTSNSFLSKGMLYGLQIGANHQLSNNVVLGLEADIAYADVKGNFNYDHGRTGAIAGTNFDGLATVRGRVGYAFDRFLPYATAGLALGHSHGYITNVYNPSGEYTSGSDFNVGWTAGAGLEYALGNNLSMKAEYLYTNFPSVNYWMSLPAPASSIHVNDDAAFHSVKVGVNWKFM